MPSVSCPLCGTLFAYGANLAGRAVRCPTCREPFRVPDAALAPEPAALPRPSSAGLGVIDSDTRRAPEPAAPPRSSSAFAKGFWATGGVFGFIVVILLGCLGISALCCGGLMTVTLQRQASTPLPLDQARGQGAGGAVTRQRQANAPLPDSEPGVQNDAGHPRWVDIRTGPITEGQVRLQVVSVVLHERIAWKKWGDGPSQPMNAEGLVIRFGVMNTSQTQFLDWSALGRFTDAHPNARLKDNLGNQYRQIAYRVWLPADQAKDTRVLPGATVVDILVFEAPLPVADTFFLELPKPDATVLNDSFYRFTFPRSAIGSAIGGSDRPASTGR
jgi:hypothetical protein